MPTNVSDNVRRCERKIATIPVKLVVKAEDHNADESALAVDISPRGARVRTKLKLGPGEWVGLVPKGGFAYAIPTRAIWVHEDEFSHWIFAGLEFVNTPEG